MKNTIKTLVAATVAAGFVISAVVYFGIVNVGADDPHFKVVHSFLAMARDRSIEVRSNAIEVPNLNDPAMIKAGAGNYNSMCVGCHLAPGMADTELSKALYPAPPNLAEKSIEEGPAAAFWVIKHGIKATGMPAWGKSMADPYIWGMVAFLEQLPEMDQTQYQTLVASSSGHQHGGGETAMHKDEGQGNSPGGHHSAAPSSNSDHHASGMPQAGSMPNHHAGEATDTDHHAGDSKVEQGKPELAPKTHMHENDEQHVH